MPRAFSRFAVCLVAVLAPATSRAQFNFNFGPPAQPQAPQGPAIAVFELKGTVSERPGATSSLLSLEESDTLQSLLTRMREAETDDDVKAVALVLKDASFGYGQLEELRAAMDRLKAADKPVYAHADSLSTASYALLCGASRLSVSPTGDVWVTGLYGEGLYVKNLLSLLGVEPDFLACGDYKSAAEMFTRSEPSPAAAEMEDWLFDSTYASLIDLIATGRKKTADEVRAWIDQGLFSAESAQAAGLIDAVEHRQDFAAKLNEEFGKNTRFDKSYGVDKGPQLDLSNPFALLMGMAGAAGQGNEPDNVIAVVYVDGPIMLGDAEVSPLAAIAGAYSEPIRRALDEVAEDDNVKGVVLRVNSPGGSAVASEIILNATKRVADKKPMVVSMGDVAGSGGYYVACGVDRIFADRTTMTGSIGVVAGKVATTNMWGRVGINFHPIRRGKNADILSSAGKFSDEQRTQLQNWMDEVYGAFKGHVVAIRGERLKKPIDELAGGRVFTGEQALALGLVDEIGGLDDAVKYIAREAGLKDYELESRPKATNFLEQILASLTGEEKEDTGRLTTPRLSTSLLEQAAPLLQGADPRRVRLLQQAARQLDIVQTERLMLTMPLIDLRD
jgi:protease-4